jgi:hypothetical protein
MVNCNDLKIAGFQAITPVVISQKRELQNSSLHFCGYVKLQVCYALKVNNNVVHNTAIKLKEMKMLIQLCYEELKKNVILATKQSKHEYFLSCNTMQLSERPPFGGIYCFHLQDQKVSHTADFLLGLLPRPSVPEILPVFTHANCMN